LQSKSKEKSGRIEGLGKGREPRPKDRPEEKRGASSQKKRKGGWSSKREIELSKKWKRCLIELLRGGRPGKGC